MLLFPKAGKVLYHQAAEGEVSSTIDDAEILYDTTTSVTELFPKLKQL
jgi:hypothetical protein